MGELAGDIVLKGLPMALVFSRFFPHSNRCRSCRCSVWRLPKLHTWHVPKVNLPISLALTKTILRRQEDLRRVHGKRLHPPQIEEPLASELFKARRTAFTHLSRLLRRPWTWDSGSSPHRKEGPPSKAGYIFQPQAKRHPSVALSLFPTSPPQYSRPVQQPSLPKCRTKDSRSECPAEKYVTAPTDRCHPPCQSRSQSSHLICFKDL